MSMNEIYYVMPVENARIAPVARRDPRRYGVAILLGAALLGAGLFSAQGRMQSLENGYRLESLERQKLQLLEANRKLVLEEASLGDPVRIDWIARNRLGMSTPAPHQIFRGEPATPGTAVVAENRTTPKTVERGAGVAAALP